MTKVYTDQSNARQQLRLTYMEKRGDKEGSAMPQETKSLNREC